MKFRKKPIIIDAWQLTQEHFTGEHPNPLHPKDARIIYYPNHKYALIATLEGDMVANIGDWIITGIKGEIYPCRSDIFDATYEAVDDLA